MFVHERRHGLQLCNREMFGDMVLVRQNPSTKPLADSSMSRPTSSCRKRATSATYEDPNERKQNERKRASQLIDELLLDIYNRNNCGSVSGYTSATSSLRSQKSFQKYTELDLHMEGRKIFYNLY